MTVPKPIKLYHIVHIDRLPSIINDGFLWCDATMMRRQPSGTVIGMSTIKQRRLTELCLSSYPDLYVGDCVPFYFCPRSVMLYLIYRANHPDLSYQGGQAAIVHLEIDLDALVAWAKENTLRWAFTLSNAGSCFFEDHNQLAALNKIDWTAVHARNWQEHKEGKQAEFLVEQKCPWHLVQHIGVHSKNIYGQVLNALPGNGHRPSVTVRRDWYY